MLFAINVGTDLHKLASFFMKISHRTQRRPWCPMSLEIDPSA